MKEGRLTALCFHVVQNERTFFGNVREGEGYSLRVYSGFGMQGVGEGDSGKEGARLKSLGLVM